MKAVSGWIDQGAQGVRLFIDIPLRKNGLPNQAAQKAVEAFFETFNPDAFDPPEPVSEATALAALRDRVVGVVTYDDAKEPPAPAFLVVDGEEPLGPPACRNGACDE